jgi:hypothetical protein
MPETLETPVAEGTSTAIWAATRAETLATAGIQRQQQKEVQQRQQQGQHSYTREKWNIRGMLATAALPELGGNGMLTTVGTQITAETTTAAKKFNPQRAVGPLF